MGGNQDKVAELERRLKEVEHSQRRTLADLRAATMAIKALVLHLRLRGDEALWDQIGKVVMDASADHSQRAPSEDVRRLRTALGELVLGLESTDTLRRKS